MIFLFSAFCSVVFGMPPKQQASAPPIVFCDPHINDEMCEVRAILGCFFLNQQVLAVGDRLAVLDEKRYAKMSQQPTLMSNLQPITGLSPESPESTSLYQAFIDNLAGAQFDMLKDALRELLQYARLDRKKIDAVKQKLLDVQKDLGDFPPTLFGGQARTALQICLDQFEQERKIYQRHCSHKQAFQTLSYSSITMSNPAGFVATLSDLHQHVAGYGEDKLKHDVRSCLAAHVVETLPIIVLIRQLGDKDLQGADVLLVYLNKVVGVNYFAVLEEAVQVVNQFGPFVQLTRDLASPSISPVDKKQAALRHVRDSLLTFQYNVQAHWTIIAHGVGSFSSEFAQKFDILKGKRQDRVFEL